MKRRDFFRMLGAIGLGALLPLPKQEQFKIDRDNTLSLYTPDNTVGLASGTPSSRLHVTHDASDYLEDGISEVGYFVNDRDMVVKVDGKEYFIPVFTIMS